MSSFCHLILCFTLLERCVAPSPYNAGATHPPSQKITKYDSSVHNKAKSHILPSLHSTKISSASQYTPYDAEFYIPEGIPICDMSQYQVLKKLGSGDDGIVDKLKEIKTGRYFARKTSFPDPQPLSNLRKEMHILKKVKGLGITADIQCVDRDMTYFIMDFLEGQTLGNYIQVPPVDMKELVFFAKKMAAIYSTLHDKSLVHLDGHPWNWMFNLKTQKLYLIDFGRALNLQLLSENDAVILKKEDVHFTGEVWKAMYYTVRMKQDFFFVWRMISKLDNKLIRLPLVLKEIINNMLNDNPSVRPTFSDIVKSLSP